MMQRMKKKLFIKIMLSVLCLTSAIFISCSSSKKINGDSAHVLVFSKTAAYRHASIAEGKLALLKIGKENKLIVDTTEDAAVFTTDNLKKYKAIIFLNTSGDILNQEQQIAFQNYIRSGGSFVGIHAATDTEKDWPWYNELAGAYFKGHPKPQVARYNILDKKFPATAFMPDTLSRLEEDLVKVVMTVDEKSYTGGNMPDFHPAVWYHTFEGGKAFYTAWGHHPETFKEPLFVKHITAAIKWAVKS
jgi:type 1 glutamine amidotransferase